MSKVRRAVCLQVGGLLLVSGGFLIAARYFPIADWIAQVQQKVMHLGAWSAVYYSILYACCNVLLLPGGLLSVGGGFFFGLWWGFLIVLVGNVTGAAIAFYLGRKVGQNWLRRKLMRNPTLEALEPAVAREGWKIILLSQLHPLFPTSLLNYLYGLTTIRFRTCILWVAIGQAPGLFLYTYIGTLGQLGLNLMRGKSHPRVIEYWVWGGGLLISAFILVVLGRISLRLLQEAEMKASQDQQRSQTLPAGEVISAEKAWAQR
ncbi:MAG: TVP38/TMEM64 family protein [Chthoniobacterales bacterium]